MEKLRFSNGQFQPKGFFAQIKDQWENMRCMPLMEYQTGQDDFMVSNLKLTSVGIEFEIDMSIMFDPKLSFSGNVIRPYANRNDIFLVPFDPFFTNLDTYLQQVDQEITEGFLLPNNLYFDN
jgi:hypothetical protein